MTKTTLRQQLSHLRQRLSPETKAQYSKQICQIILNTPMYQQAQTIGMYLATPDEVNLASLVDITPHKLFYLPVLQDDYSLHFHHYDADTILQVNRWGILEPIPQSVIDIHLLDLLLIPLLGFDNQGHRLGMGKGCYDRSIPNDFIGKKVGVGFSCQYYPHIPYEAHDIAMDCIVTEKQIILSQGK